MKNCVHDQIDIMSHSRVTVKPGSYMLLPHVNLMISRLPKFKETKVHILATPDIGAKFVQYELMMEPGGGTIEPIGDGLEHFCFVLDGNVTLNILGESKHDLTEGGFAFLPAGSSFELSNHDDESRVVWIKRKFVAAGSLKPDLIVGSEKDVIGRPGQLLTPFDKNLAYDMGMLIVNLEPGRGISQVETHIMQHGLYMIQGQGIYWLDRDFHEVQANDYIYLSSYCSQYFYVTGETTARYLLYKDVNRDFEL
jgi:(S)-ureidoglycine aminohydrolase